MYKLSQLIDEIKYAIGEKIENIEVSGACADSKAVMPSEAFFCIKGTKSDGKKYINEAVKRGAGAIVTETELNASGCPVVIVRNVRSAYSVALSRIYGSPSEKMKMIAVTGTNGKTTVCSMISSALNLSGRKCAMIGTLGAGFNGKKTSLSSMTTPDPEVLYALLGKYAEAGAEYVVMEASSHSLALNKLDGIHFDISAITNMSAEHLDFHGDMERYYEAKRSLFDRSEKAVILCDDFYTRKMCDEISCKCVTCSVTDTDCDYYAENIGCSFENGTVLTMVGKFGSLPLHSDIPAEFTVSNIMLAATVLKELGLSGNEIYRGISALKGVDGRMERVETHRDFSVFIDFAHTPDALFKLLTSVRSQKKVNERIVTLFGCGGDRDKSKRSLMGAVASHLSDMVIVTADNSRSEDTAQIIEEILSGVDKGKACIRIDDREKAIEYAIMNAGSGDIILLCGKGHETYEIGKNGKRPFSEKEIVKKALIKRKCETEK